MNVSAQLARTFDAKNVALFDPAEASVVTTLHALPVTGFDLARRIAGARRWQGCIEKAIEAMAALLDTPDDAAEAEAFDAFCCSVDRETGVVQAPHVLREAFDRHLTVSEAVEALGG